MEYPHHSVQAAGTLSVFLSGHRTVDEKAIDFRMQSITPCIGAELVAKQKFVTWEWVSTCLCSEQVPYFLGRGNGKKFF